MKWCCGCQNEKPVKLFAKNRSKSDGLADHCKDCNRIYRAKHKDKAVLYNREYRIENRETLRLKSLDKRRINPEKSLHQQAKKRAREKELEFSITEQDCRVPEFCPYLGIRLQVSQQTCSDNSPSLDRIDPAKGYTPDNVIVCSYRANSIKRDASPDELIKIAITLKNLQT